jgi:hypothetical protein
MLPVFESVMVCAALVVPIAVFGNETFDGERTAWGIAGGTPVPARATVCGDPVALSATLTPAL